MLDFYLGAHILDRAGDCNRHCAGHCAKQGILMGINFRQLEVFRAVAEHRSFTRASHVLLISQSTVSQHIRELLKKEKIAGVE